MRELFYPSDFPVRDVMLLRAINDAYDTMARRGTPPNLMQLYAYLVRGQRFAEDEVPFRRFTRLVERGLYSGYVDWDLVPHEPATVISDEAPREVFLYDRSMLGFASDFCKLHRSNLSVRSLLGWLPQTFYAAVNRIAVHGCQVEALYVSSNLDATRDLEIQSFELRLRWMLHIRIARFMVNHDFGKEIWPAAVGPRQRFTVEVKRKIRATREAAEEFVTSNFSFKPLIVSPSSEWPERDISEVAPRRLASAMKRMLERVPRGVCA